MPGRVCRACIYSARTLFSDALSQVQGALWIQIRNDQRSGASSGNGKRDCPSRAARTDKQNGFPERGNALALHAQHASKSVKHSTHPASVTITTYDVDCADLKRSGVKLVHKIQHALLVRHGDQKPSEVTHGAKAFDEVVEASGPYLKGNTNRVKLCFGK
jgi:hypothetical protein